MQGHLRSYKVIEVGINRKPYATSY